MPRSLWRTKVEIAVKPPKYTSTSNQPVQLRVRGIGALRVFKDGVYEYSKIPQIRIR
jgi:hypothetical protein